MWALSNEQSKSDTVQKQQAILDSCANQRIPKKCRKQSNTEYQQETNLRPLSTWKTLFAAARGVETGWKVGEEEMMLSQFAISVAGEVMWDV